MQANAAPVSDLPLGSQQIPVKCGNMVVSDNRRPRKRAKGYHSYIETNAGRQLFCGSVKNSIDRVVVIDGLKLRLLLLFRCFATTGQREDAFAAHRH